MMHKIFFASALACFIVTSFAATANEVVRSPQYLQSQMQFEMFPGRYKYLMIGDSITERGHWADMFPGIGIGNRGIGGDDTSGMIARIDALKKTGATKVFIMAGTNDLTRHVDPAVIASNIILIAKELALEGITPIVQSTLYSGRLRAWKNPKIDQINAFLMAKCEAEGFIFVNLNKKLAPNGYLPDELTIDGTHLTALGYAAWREELVSFIK